MTLIKTIRTYLVLSILSLALFVPQFAFAAFNDVVFSGGGELSVGGVTLTVVPISQVQQVVVNANTFVFTMAPGSGVKVSATNRETISHDADVSYVDASVCDATESSVVFDVPSNNTTNVTITVTPSTAVCAGAASGGSAAPGSIVSSGGGGSSSSSSSSSSGSSSPAPSSPPTTTITKTSLTTTTGVSGVSTFTRTLKSGMTGNDILALQKLLNSDPDTQISSSGVGSPGQETNYFGNLTRIALRKFQAKYGIVSSGNEDSTGYGLVGPSTRAKLNELSGGSVSAPTPSAKSSSSSTPITSVSAQFTRGLSKGAENSDIKTLQKLLNSDPDTQISSSGVGSPGQETNYFGSLTEKAVQKFQEKHNIAGPGDPGYGHVGPKTRAKLNELSSSSNSTNNPTGSAEAQLQRQIQDALEQIQKLQAQIQSL